MTEDMSQLTRDEIAARFIDRLEYMLDRGPGTITETDDFVETLGADSLDYIEILMSAEEMFDIEIPDDAAENVASVKQAIDYIVARLAEEAEAALVVCPAPGGPQ